MLTSAVKRSHKSPPILHYLNEAQLGAYQRDGFLIVPSVFCRAEIDRISRAIDALKAIALNSSETHAHYASQFVLSTNKAGRPRIERIVGVGATIPYLGLAGRSQRLLHLASQVLKQKRLTQLINQVHYKHSGDEVAFEWHQDSRHRRYGTKDWTDIDGQGSFVEIITAIDRMTLENGPLQVIPESHRLGHLAVNEETKSLPPRTFCPADAVPVLMAPGDAVLLHPFTIHGSTANTSKNSRRIFLNGFCIRGANHRHYPDLGTGLQVDAPPHDLSH